MHPVRILMKRMIDYAGLFPPAGLEMRSAVANYAHYRESEYAWALGRLIVPVSRLGKFEAAAHDFLPRDPQAAPWLLSVLGDLPADHVVIQAFNERHRAGGDHGAAQIDTIELKASSPEAIRSCLQAMPDDLLAYVEIPIANDPAELIQAIGQAGGRAKVRTGGTSQEMFPPAEDLLRFIGACVTANVPFKATAGLHHPIRSRYRLTYEQDSPTGTMYGFLNVFLGAAFLRAGINVDEAMYILTEESPSAFQFDERGVRWHNRFLDGEALANTRQQIAISYGSCSFEEPIDDLKAMKLL